MDEFVSWLSGCLNEDERIAREAGGLAWYRPAEYLGDPAAIRDSEQERVVCYEGWPSEGQTVHIAEWDPARVLREIGSKRQLLADVLAETHTVVEDCWYTCPAATEEHDGGQTCYDASEGKPCNCGRDARVARRLQLLALPFEHRPGFAEAIASLG
ncbi:DUF6221 family protein [Streptomyces prunicolor]